MPTPNQMGEVLPNRRREVMTVREKECKTCGQTKPINQFRRTLSLAQSRALLQRPQLTKPHTLISALCKDCQAQMRRNKTKKPYTASEIAKKIESGDIHPTVGEQRIKRKTSIANAKRAIGQKLRWQAQRMKPIEEHLERIRTEIASYRGRYYAYKLHLQKNYEQIIQAQHDLLEQHRRNYEEAKLAYREEIKPRIPRATDHQDLFTMFLNIRLSHYFTPHTHAKVVMNPAMGMFATSYDMSNCLVTTRNDKWWRVIEDKGLTLLVVEADRAKANPRKNVLQKSSITGVNKPKGEAQ